MANRLVETSFKPVAVSAAMAPLAYLTTTMLGLLLVSFAGCGSGAATQVSGVVNLDGKPVPDATVIFSPKSGGQPAIGKTNATGEFRLRTATRSEGVERGVYQVAVIAKQVSRRGGPAGGDGDLASLPSTTASRPPKVRWIVPESYSTPSSSGLEFEVQTGVENYARFDLKSRR